MTTDEDSSALAAGVMVAWCGWDPTVRVTETVLIDGAGTRLLQLPSLMVVDVSEVSVAKLDGSFDTPLTIGPGGLVQWSDNGILELPRNSSWPSGRRNVSVTYTGGYDPAPADLAAALRSLGERLGSSRHGATYKKIGTGAIGYGRRLSEGDLLVTEQMVLDRYRIPRVR